MSLERFNIYVASKSNAAPTTDATVISNNYLDKMLRNPIAMETLDAIFVHTNCTNVGS